LTALSGQRPAPPAGGERAVQGADPDSADAS